MKKKEPIAIVGMACRFPGGANNPENFWRLLIDGTDAITEIDAARWSWDYYYHPDPSVPGKTYARFAGQLDSVWDFEPGFFGLSPREAVQMDPQQRLLLELTWEALEAGNQIPAKLAGTDCSVYIGISSTDYANVRFDDPSVADSYFMTGNTLSIAANRISHLFDLRGPSLAIDTACSSFAVALHQACTSLWNHATPACIVGATHLLLSPFPFIGFSKASMLSPDGRCKFFDARANGYVRSEGGAIFYLKPLSAAEADNDPIQAVILATGVNTDGGEMSLTVPDGNAQMRLLESVYQGAGIKAEQICYIEAHGTGTQVGDPIEAYSIGQGIGVKRDKNNPIPLGSVKSNIGHLEPASGAAGLMKVILSLQHRSIPPSINFESLNPNIDVDSLNLKLVTEQLSLPDNSDRLIMGVNSFGFGGSNAHAVVAEYNGREPVLEQDRNHKLPPLFLSAETPESLKAKANQFADLLNDDSSVNNTYDIFYTAALHRQRLRHGLAVYGETPAAISSGLEAFANGREAVNVVASEKLDQADEVALVFSGNGSQWPGMGKGLLAIPEFRTTIEKIDDVFEPLAGWSILKELLQDEAETRLEYTEIAQPLLFAIQLGLLELLKSSGIHPSAVFGHSVGEVAAAYAAGILDLEQAVRVIHYRSQAQGKTKGMGKMAAAQVSKERAGELLEIIGGGLELGAVNSPKSVTFTGPIASIERLANVLADERTFCRILDLDYAFHSKYMDDVREEFLENIGEVQRTTGSIEYISTVTGTSLTGQQLDSAYWWRNLRDPVLFSHAMSTLTEHEHGVFVEVGPHPVLKTYILECLRQEKKKGKCVVTLKRNGKDEQAAITRALYETVLATGRQSLESFFKTKGKQVSLPAYPWHREKYRQHSSNEAINRTIDHALLGVRSSSVAGLWQNQIDLNTHPFLQDHMVDGVAVFPAAAYIEMALAASQYYFERDQLEISSFEIRRPLVFEQGQTKEVQFSLCTEDMNFIIRSRTRLSGQSWNTHAIGKFVNHAGSGREFPFDYKQFKSDADHGFSKEEIYRLAAGMGLQYGENFQGIDVIWISKDTLVSRYNRELCNRESQGNFILGPAVLDSAFHTLFPAILDRAGGLNRNPGAPYLPVAVGKINYYGIDTPVDCCIGKILNYSSHSITASFLLLDETGRVVAGLDKCFFKQMSTASRQKDSPSFYEFRQIPSNHIDLQKIFSLPALDELESVITESITSNRLLADEVIVNEQILPLFDALAASIAVRTLRELGAHIGEFTTDSLLTASGITTEHRQFINNMLLLLQEDGKAVCNEGRWKLQLDNDDDESTAIWRSIIADYPACLPEIMATLKVGFNLVDLLTNSPQEELIKRSLQAQVNHFALSRIVVEVIRNIIEYVVDDWPVSKRRLRVAEILDSNASITRHLMSYLHKDFCDVHLFATDESIKVRAEQNFNRFANVTVSVLNQAADALAHEFDEGEFDILISLNWMHKCEDILKSFSQLSYLVASGGLLLFAEKQPNRLIDINCGVNPDWWLRNSEVEQPVSMLMEADDWLVALEKTEFHGGRILTDAISPGANNFVIAANREIRSKAKEEIRIEKEHPWLLISDDEGQSIALAETLQFELATIGIQAIVGRVPRAEVKGNGNDNYLADEQDYERLFTNIRKEYASLEHIVYLNGLSLASGISNAGLIEGQARCCMGVVNLLKSIESIYWDSLPRLWLITNESCLQDNLSDRPRTPVLPNQSTLWGLGRVIRNEFPNIDCKLLDLQIGHNLQKLSHALIEEVLRADEEDEIILTQDARKVMRLEKIIPRELTAASDGLQMAEVKQRARLSFTTPGHMDNLYWQKQQQVSLKPGEIEIEVVATGLNFRDIMFASGLLPDEMLDNGYAGATLGLECAGIVSRTSDDVTDFQPGDEVIAFAPASFGSHVITRTISVTHKPPHWSFEEAATIPTAFFTVYYSLGHLARLEEGEKVLIHGAAGGVGLAAIQYARFCGAEIFATAGTEEKRQFLKELGVEHVLNSRTLDFADEIMEITEGKGIDVVLNSLAGEAIDKNFSILKPFGRFLELGKRDFMENTQIGLRPFRNNIAYYGIDADQIIAKQPELAKNLFSEIMELFESGYFRPLTHVVYPASDIASAFRLMQHSGHIGKIVVTIKDEIGTVVDDQEIQQHVQLNDKASYLITGGMSGFGLATARWLIDRGARHLILLGRRTVQEAGIEKNIDDMNLAGVKVTSKQCDVSDPMALQKVLRDIEESHPPLKGIVHAAMVLDDSTIRTMTEESMMKVFKPKIQGAWNLHQLTINLDLDFFILYSSATTYIGNPGQGSYVAANHYLESLARYRKAQGLPALAIAWDAIMDSGYLARNEELRETFRKRLGVKGINTNQAFREMDKAIISGMTEASVLNANWPAMKRLLPIISSPTYHSLTHAITDDDTYENSQDIMDIIEGLSKEEVHILITNMLTDELAKILQLPAEKVEQNRSIQDLGVDSLMAMELVSAIENRFSIEIPIMAMSDNSTVDSIAARITRILTGDKSLEHGPDSDAVLVRSLAATHAEEFTETEIDEFTREYVEDKNTTRRMIQ